MISYGPRDDLAKGANLPPSVEVAAAGARYQRWIRQTPTLTQLLAVLPKDTVYIEIVDYQRQDAETLQRQPDPNGSLDLFRPSGEQRYLALAAWKDGNQLRLSTAELGSVANLDAEVVTLRQRIQQVAPLGDLPHQLYSKLLGQFDGAIRTARQLVLAPAGGLNLLPFEALQPREGVYLADQAVILYGNVRDLLADELMSSWQKNEPPTPGLILADPAYDLAAAATEESAEGAEQADQCGPGTQRGLKLVAAAFPLHFQALPCTKLEADAIKRLSPPRTQVLTGGAATETALRQHERPEFLHLATHGLLLPPPTVHEPGGGKGSTYLTLDNAPVDIRLLVDPLLAASVALAGANGGERGLIARASYDDGLLSAAEAQRLNLAGTRLVVMSACETGQGLPGAGGSFFGLRHAFRSAGAEAVVGSLWRVNDTTTSWFMSSFYRRFFAGEPAAVALQRARRELRGKCPDCGHPYFWAPFIIEGAKGAFSAHPPLR